MRWQNKLQRYPSNRAIGSRKTARPVHHAKLPAAKGSRTYGDKDGTSVTAKSRHMSEKMCARRGKG
jgi:hypothetical protein